MRLSSIPARTLGTSLAAALVVACSASKDAKSTDTTASNTSTTSASAGNVAAPDSTATAATTTPAASTSTPAADPSQFTDENILAKEAVGDSTEVAVADWVKSSSASAPVKAYATLLSTDHAKGLKSVHTLTDELKLTPAAPAGDTTEIAATHMLDRLKGMSGKDIDTAFVNHAIADHKEDIDDAKKMSGAAKNAKVKALVEKSLPELKKHLDRAESLAKSSKA